LRVVYIVAVVEAKLVFEAAVAVEVRIVELTTEDEIEVVMEEVTVKAVVDTDELDVKVKAVVVLVREARDEVEVMLEVQVVIVVMVVLEFVFEVRELEMADEVEVAVMLREVADMLELEVEVQLEVKVEVMGSRDMDDILLPAMTAMPATQLRISQLHWQLQSQL
jgi:hypothetical protein